MDLLEQEIVKIEASIKYDETDTLVMENSINAITAAGCKLEAKICTVTLDFFF